LGAEASGAVQFEFLVEFGTGRNGIVFVGEAGVRVDFELDGKLEGVQESVSHLTIDASVEECALDFHDGEHDGFGAFEDGEFDAGILVHANGSADADTAPFATIPLVMEVTERVVTKRGGAAF